MTPPTPPAADAEAATRVGVESHGVDTIPESERTSRPREMVSILLGGDLSLGVIFFGFLPVAFGLGFWASLSSMAVGTALGVALVAPLALVSQRSATNLSTSSGAYFGVRGRLIGSAIGLLLSLGYTAQGLWLGGDALIASLHRLIGLPQNPLTYGVTYAVLAVLIMALAIYGYQMIVRATRWLMVSMVALLLVGLVAYAPSFTTEPVAGYLFGDFWTTWIFSAVAVGISGPIALITIIGDYSRYMSRRHSGRRVAGATALGLFLALMVPQAFGTFTALAAGAGNAGYVGPLVAAAPIWFLLPLVVNALFGTAGYNGLMVYSMGLDLDAILPRRSRTQTTIAVSVIAAVLVFFGHFVWNLTDAVTSFVLLLTALGVPWGVITLLSFVRTRGAFDHDALQVFNRRQKGGLYWYRGGWNPAIVAVWTLGSVAGLLAVDTPLYSGPLVHLLGGLDLNVPIAAAVTAGAYLIATRRRPLPTPGNAAAEPGRLVERTAPLGHDNQAAGHAAASTTGRTRV